MFKRFVTVLFVLLVLTAVVPAFAQSPDDVQQIDTLDRIIQLTQQFFTAFITLFVAVFGAFVWLTRINNKAFAALVPSETASRLFDLAETIAKYTPSTLDDKAIADLRDQFMSGVYDAVDDAVSRALQSASEDEE